MFTKLKPKLKPKLKLYGAVKKYWRLVFLALLSFGLIACDPQCEAETAKKTKDVFFSVSFDPRNDNDIWQVTVKSGETVTKPAEDPTKGLHHFQGWYTKDEDKEGNFKLADKSFDFATPITKNIKLYGKWGKLPPGFFYVSFDPRNGSAIWYVNIKSGETVTRPAEDPTKKDYDFSDWYAKLQEKDKDGNLKWADTPFDFATPITQNIQLYGRWLLPNHPFQNIEALVYHKDYFYATNNYKNCWDCSKSLLLKINAQTGEREIFSQHSTRGKGPAFSTIKDIIYHNGYFYVTNRKHSESGKDSIFRIHETTGDRQIFSKGGVRGSGPNLTSASELIFHNNAFYVANLGSVIKIDASTGERTLFSKGTGPMVPQAASTGITFYNNAFYLADYFNNGILKMNASTGAVEIFSSAKNGKGKGPAFMSSQRILYHSNAFYVPDNDMDGIMKVDARTGARTVFSKADARGSGQPLNNPKGIIHHGNAFYVAADALNAIVKINETTGNRTIFSK